MADHQVDQPMNDIQKEYLEFLDDEEDQGKYNKLVKNMIFEKNKRLTVSINDLRQKFPSRAKSLLNNAFDEQLAFQRALKEYVFSISYEYAKSNEDFFIAYEGSFGNKHVTPRILSSRYLGNLICVEGIVIKCSLIRPKVVRSVHYCEVTGKVLERKYTDLTSMDAFPSSTVYPTKDDDGNPLETEYGLSAYKDHQTVTIQELPEKAPAGQLPRSVDIICDNDLVDQCKPGDRVQVVGTYRCLPGKQGGFTSGTFRTVLIANNLQQISKEAIPAISRDDIATCKQLAKTHRNVFELLAKSLAPSIHGHDYIKKAILCLLLGGVEKVLQNGTRLRGDINVLLVGDPSVAKSQLLRYVLCTAPRAIPTTGRGSSGVGLTAAVTTDQETGERRLEAGAMVLGDRGVVCIDEFDKMSDVDRTAIHEVMEQGRVTISKAGIHASLNARCSVLAAANPVYGKYDQYKTPMENIGLQDSLLSRFDLLFVMLDAVDEDQDMRISDHIVRMHRWRSAAERDGEVLSVAPGADLPTTHGTGPAPRAGPPTLYEKYDPLLHAGSRKRTDKVLNVDFMRKYIHFVKIMRPTLTEQASELIAEEYSRLRSEEHLESHVARTQPVTARSLETMIRLATAHAKARMSGSVTAEDAQVAIELVQYAYFKKVLEKEKRAKRRRGEDDDDGQGGDGGDDDEDEDGQGGGGRAKRTRTAPDQSEPSDVYRYSDGEESEVAGSQVSTRSRAAAPAPSSVEQQQQAADTQQLTDERLGLFKSKLQRVFQERRAQSLAVARVSEAINAECVAEPFSHADIDSALHRMEEENQIMLADGIVFLI